MPGYFSRILFLFLLCSSQFLFAQKETNWWYFGWQISVDFNSGSPVAVNNSAMNQYEGCSSMSDKTTGTLLLYSDGQDVFGSNHAVMPNGSGLTGNQSGAQSAL